MVEAVRRVASSVDVPVTADIEAGYAESPDELADNVRGVLDAGAVGINLEDSRFDGDLLHSIPAQQERLRAVCDLEPGIEFTRARARQLLGDADAALAELAPGDARDAMRSLCNFVLERTF